MTDCTSPRQQRLNVSLHNTLFSDSRHVKIGQTSLIFVDRVVEEHGLHLSEQLLLAIYQVSDKSVSA